MFVSYLRQLENKNHPAAIETRACGMRALTCDNAGDTRRQVLTDSKIWVCAVEVFAERYRFRKYFEETFHPLPTCSGSGFFDGVAGFAVLAGVV